VAHRQWRKGFNAGGCVSPSKYISYHLDCNCIRMGKVVYITSCITIMIAWLFQIYKHVYEYTICILIKQLFFDIRILISPLVSSNSSYYKDYVLVIIIFILLTISKFVLSCKISFCFGVLYCDLVWTDWFSNPHYLQHVIVYGWGRWSILRHASL
jgi:hypothetical protein